MQHSLAHPGFQNVQNKIEHGEGVSHAAAGRILGYAKTHASASARKKNPRLNRKGGKRKYRRMAEALEDGY